MQAKLPVGSKSPTEGRDVMRSEIKVVKDLREPSRKVAIVFTQPVP